MTITIDTPWVIVGLWLIVGLFITLIARDWIEFRERQKSGKAELAYLQEEIAKRQAAIDEIEKKRQ